MSLNVNKFKDLSDAIKVSLAFEFNRNNNSGKKITFLVRTKNFNDFSTESNTVLINLGALTVAWFVVEEELAKLVAELRYLQVVDGCGGGIELVGKNDFLPINLK